MSLTASRPELLRDGSDALLRQVIHDALGFSVRLLEIRDRLAEAIGLSGPAYSILIAIEHLSETGEVGVARLSEHLHQAGAFVALEVAKLVKAGLVSRTPDPQAGQRVVLSVTERGQARLDELVETQRPVNDAIFAGLDAQQFSALADMVASLLSGTEEGLARLRQMADQRRLVQALGKTTSDEARAFRNALGQFPTGIVVVTAAVEGRDPIALTVSSFNAVSLDPPLVLFSVRREVYGLQFLLDASHFGISVLRADQHEISSRFAFGKADKWVGFEPAAGETGCPLIWPSLAAFECTPFATYDGGDHLIIVGRVERFEAAPEGDPLVFFRGGYHAIAASPTA